MPTSHIYRVYLLAPAARMAALNAWIKSAIDPSGGTWIAPTLSATGLAPYTHGWCSFACDDAQAVNWATRLAAVAGVAVPAGFAAYTRSQKVAHLQNSADTLRQQTGVRIWACDNDGAWLTPAALLAQAGLKAIRRTPGVQ